MGRIETFEIGAKVKVQIGRGFAHGRHWRGGWRVGVITDRTIYPNWTAYTVDTDRGTVTWTGCNPECIRHH